MSKSTINIVNKRAGFEYHFIQKYQAGIVLTGSEIKSIRAGNVNMNDAYCFFKDDELWIRNMHISQYKQASHFNHEPMRIRKLLLKKIELRKLLSKSKEKGLTIVPVKIFLSETGYAKIEIALAKGKKTYDKRDDIKKRDLDRDMKRSLS
jgi:SsrA-binding protein